MKYRNWSAAKTSHDEKGHRKADASADMESYDLLGKKSINGVIVSNKILGKLQFVPFQLIFLKSNYGLASNQGMKALNSQQIQNTPLEQDNMLKIVSDSVLAPPPSSKIIHKEAAKALFWSSLPDLFSELGYAWENDKSRLPSGLITFLCNVPLLVFHILAQGVQALCQILSLPTMLTGMALRSSEEANSTLGQVGFMIFAGLSAIITAPFQLFNIISNTIGYARHVIDGAVTFAKALVNILVDGVSGFIKWRFFNDKENPMSLKDTLKDNFIKNVGQMWYALTDTVKNAFRLVPAAAAMAIAYVTGGISLAATEIATASVGAIIGEITLLSILTQALSVIRIKVGDVGNFLGDGAAKLMSSAFESVSNWFNEKFKSNETEMHVTDVAMAVLGGSGPKQDEDNDDEEDEEEEGEISYTKNPLLESPKPPVQVADKKAEDKDDSESESESEGFHP